MSKKIVVDDDEEEIPNKIIEKTPIKENKIQSVKKEIKNESNKKDNKEN